MNLTQTQIEDFRIAHAIENCPDLRDADRAKQLKWADLDDADIVQTHETLVEFTASQGKPKQTIEVNGRQFHIWSGVQMQFGKTRGSLYLMEFDGVSASYFSGQK